MKVRTTTHNPRIALALLLVAGFGAVLVASGPGSATLADWRAYVSAVEARRASEVTQADRFLALDFSPDAEADRRSARSGGVLVRQIEPVRDVRDGWVHHWRGAVFVPGIGVDTLVSALAHEPPPQADVLERRVLSRTPDGMTVYLRLRRSQVITVVYDTEHDVRFVRYGAGRAGSRTEATRIDEVADAGTPRELRLGPDEDHGFFWRLHAYWRYEEVDGGVMVECESIALSRSAPFGLGVLAGVVARRAAAGSLEAALTAVADLGATLRTPHASSPAR